MNFNAKCVMNIIRLDSFTSIYFCHMQWTSKVLILLIGSLTLMYFNVVYAMDFKSEGIAD